MKHIILVENMNCQKCADKITRALEDANIEAEVLLDKKSVVVAGRGDVVAQTKRLLTDLGYSLL